MSWTGRIVPVGYWISRIQEGDRSITHYLYGGDWENRLKQEILLGIGGIRALRKLNIQADVYHCNEGHAAFTGLERLREYVAEDQLSFAEAMEVVRASSLFTRYAGSAGHDSFTENLLKNYFWFVAERLKITWEQLLGLGRVNANDPNEKFSMSFLAANLSQEVNGVSWLHGKVSRDIFKNLCRDICRKSTHQLCNQWSALPDLGGSGMEEKYR